MDYLTPLSCTDLDLVLGNDGILRLYSGRARDRSEESVIWTSTRPTTTTSNKEKKWRKKKGKKGKKEEEEETAAAKMVLSDKYIAQVDERSR